MDTRLELRAEHRGESSVVRDVVARAFRDEHVGLLVDTLRTSDAWLGLSFVAERKGEVLAHVSFTRSLLDAPRALVDVLVLSPLSVLPEAQGQGVGTALIRWSLAQLDDRVEPLVFLEGPPDYYARFGFVAGADLGFRRPSLRIPERAFQVLPRVGHEEWMTGTLVYHRTWWDHDSVGLRS